MNPTYLTGTRPRRKEPLRTLTEALLVTVAGLALALLANQLSPRGLSLSRDYFPRAPVPPATTTPPAPGTADAGEAVTASAAPANPAGDEAVRARIEARGFRFIESAEARQLFEDPRRAQELVVFLDARNDQHYQEGHVPGAYQFDHYYPGNHLPVVMPVCQQAEVIVVYCSGGDCEDSEFAAVALQEAGIPADRLAVYGGGMADWLTHGLPVEVGPRGSGQMREAKP
jgi:rhodanese-related sulfurtransferase